MTPNTPQTPSHQKSNSAHGITPQSGNTGAVQAEAKRNTPQTPDPVSSNAEDAEREAFMRWFHDIKDKRNNRHMDEPDFDEAVWQYIQARDIAQRQAVIAEIESKSPRDLHPELPGIAGTTMGFEAKGFNKANASWRTALQQLKAPKGKE